MVKVFCKNTGTSREFQEGTSLLDMLYEFEFDKPWPILAAKVNYVTQGLKFRVFSNKTVEFLDYRSYAGRGTYNRSLYFLLCKAAKDVYPDCSVTLKRPVSKGCLCILKKDGEIVNAGKAEAEAISARMRELVKLNLPFRRFEVQTEEAVEMFRKLGQIDKVKLLETSGQVYVSYYTLDGTPDYFYDCLVPTTGMLDVWALEPFDERFLILRVPSRHNPGKTVPLQPQPKTMKAFDETMKWNSIMGLGNVGDVNEICSRGGASTLIQVAEALQEKKIVQIAEEIDRRYRSETGPVRLVLITGPTSSGKSTFCKRLSIQLAACGLIPVSFSTDDYFVNRVDTPKLPDGSYDFDNFDTVDHDALQRDVLKLLAGEEVSVPEYNFVTGIREYNGKMLSLTPGKILLIEGIHALNPALTNLVDESLKFRVFINTITSISLDNHNSIPTSDNRLLRRIVRDFNKGAFSARESIAAWPNVRRSEVKWIYPYQETADVLFNSAYLVEFAVLRTHAEWILSTVPKNCREYGEAFRLIQFLSYFIPVSDKDVPATSLLRGFIGGGSF